VDRHGANVNAVVDTNVVAYYLLATEPFVDETRRFWRAVGLPMAPALWAAEFANVIWMAIRTGVLDAAEGHRHLDLAARLRIRSVSIRTLWQAALARATTSGIPVYDTLFVELAIRRRLPLVTFDAKILKAFPDTARRPAALLSS
jgi:predicted nucleic acid-binding protein